MNKFNLLPAAAALIIVATACCSQDPKPINIIPYPNTVEIHNGSFDASGAPVSYDASLEGYSEQAILDFAAQLSTATGHESEVSKGTGSTGFVFAVNENLPAEAYEIEITKKAVKVKASALNGFLYSIETLKQMLPVAIYGGKGVEGDWSLPCVSIKDAPRFAYRGQHIDIARHFFDVQEMKKVLDIMLTHKINTLHWHLSDDQGWRIEIEKYPRLTSVGSMRKGTVVKKNWDQFDGIPYGGYYTKDQIREVIEYAASKGITVIPEIDLPGHMQAALAAYPELGCTGGPYEVWQIWGVSDDVLCAGNEKTMQFLEDVLAEVADLFPSEYFHIGGDECPKVRWEKCPVCQAKIKELGIEDGEYSAEHYLQSYVMERMEKFLTSKGKKIIGWDEILEGTPGPTATIMSWRGSEGGIMAAATGHDAIMTPNSHFYFDYYQSEDVDHEPFGIGGYLPIEKVYSYEPYTEEMDENARGHIIGVQANLWTEYIAEPWHLEYMLLPRQAALSEVQWCQPENKDWDRFRAALDRETEMYEIRGYNYAKTVFQAPKETPAEEE